MMTAAHVRIGYYAYVPPGYDPQRDDRYPLLVFLHGSGERGNGTTELPYLLRNGPPKLIEDGRNFPFIVIAPQLPLKRLWKPDLVDGILKVIKKRYLVDSTRAYLTGLSLGGHGTWAYAESHPNRLAAAVPIAGRGDTTRACAMKDVPVWAFHGGADPTVDPSGSVNMINAINACSPPPQVAPKLTIYPGDGHDSWVRTYDGSAGYDVFAWMLQYHK
jgi:predicted peptidase